MSKVGEGAVLEVQFANKATHMRHGLPAYLKDAKPLSHTLLPKMTNIVGPDSARWSVEGDYDDDDDDDDDDIESEEDRWANAKWTQYVNNNLTDDSLNTEQQMLKFIEVEPEMWVKAHTIEGTTPMDYACKNKWERVIRVLESGGVRTSEMELHQIFGLISAHRPVPTRQPFSIS
jgi:hypothetical protein